MRKIFSLIKEKGTEYLKYEERKSKTPTPQSRKDLQREKDTHDTTMKILSNVSFINDHHPKQMRHAVTWYSYLQSSCIYEDFVQGHWFVLGQHEKLQSSSMSPMQIHQRLSYHLSVGAVIPHPLHQPTHKSVHIITPVTGQDHTHHPPPFLPRPRAQAQYHPASEIRG